VPDRDRPADRVQLVVVDAELALAVEQLRRERLVQLDDVDVVELEAVALQELRHGEDRPDPHLLGAAARHRGAPVDSERLDAELLRARPAHQERRGRAVGELRGVARGDGAALFRLLEHGLQLREPGERGVGAVALVGLDGEVLVVGLLVLLDHAPTHLHRHDVLGDLAPLDRLRITLLALQRVLVLILARDLVALGDDLGGEAHREVQAREALLRGRVDHAVPVRRAVLHHRPLLAHDRAAVTDELTRQAVSDVDRHELRGLVLRRRDGCQRLALTGPGRFCLRNP
jgi:hypothetical protein